MNIGCHECEHQPKTTHAPQVRGSTPRAGDGTTEFLLHTFVYSCGQASLKPRHVPHVPGRERDCRPPLFFGVEAPPHRVRSSEIAAASHRIARAYAHAAVLAARLPPSSTSPF